MNPLVKQNFMRPLINRGKDFAAILKRLLTYNSARQKNVYVNPKNYQN